MANQEITADKAESSKTFIIVALILFVSALGPFASDSYLPSLPAMARELGSSASAMQLTITLYLLGVSLSQLVYGPLSDRYGRKPIILIGLSIAVLGSTLCVFAVSSFTLILARLIQGIGMGVTNSLFRAVMRDTFSGSRLAKIASYTGMIFSIAPAAAPIIGGYLQTNFGWEANFIFISALAGTSWLSIWYLLPETNVDLNPQATNLKIVFSNYLELLTNKKFIGFALCSSLAFAGAISYCAISPFLFQDVLGLTPVQYGWLAITITFGILCGQLTNSMFVQRLGINTMLKTGMYLMLASGSIMLLIGLLGILNVSVVMAPTFIFIFGISMIFPNAMAGAFTPFAKKAGSAGAVYGCLQMLSGFVATALVAGLHERTQNLLASIFVAFGLITLFLFETCIKEKEPEALATDIQ